MLETTRSERLVPSCSASLLVLLSVTADAGLIRRGGAGTAVAPPVPGEAVYMLEAKAPRFSSDSDSARTFALLQTDLDAGTRFSFWEGDGEAFQVHHDWGNDCPQFVSCFFTLGLDEALVWGGHAIGVPDVLVGDPRLMGDAATPGLRFEWRLRSVGNPDNVLVWADDDPEAFPGQYLDYSNAFQNDEQAALPGGCHVVKAKRHKEGGCQPIGLDTSRGVDSLTGADIIEQLGPGPAELQLQVTYRAPAGFAFFTVDRFTENDTDIISGFTLSDTFVADGTYPDLSAASSPMRVVIGDVPEPPVLVLFGVGLLMLGGLRSRFMAAPELNAA